MQKPVLESPRAALAELENSGLTRRVVNPASSELVHEAFSSCSAQAFPCDGLFVPAKDGVSASPTPVEVLQSNATGLPSHIPQGFPVPWPDPQAGEPDVGPRTFTTVGELLRYYCSPVCGWPTW